MGEYERRILCWTVFISRLFAFDSSSAFVCDILWCFALRHRLWLNVKLKVEENEYFCRFGVEMDGDILGISKKHQKSWQIYEVSAFLLIKWQNNQIFILSIHPRHKPRKRRNRVSRSLTITMQTGWMRLISHTANCQCIDERYWSKTVCRCFCARREQ